MEPLYASIACNLDAGILSASLPLWEEERVSALEWSFDALFRRKGVPAWFEELLTLYSDAGRLIGHGVFFSLFPPAGCQSRRHGCSSWSSFANSIPSIILRSISAL